MVLRQKRLELIETELSTSLNLEFNFMPASCVRCTSVKALYQLKKTFIDPLRLRTADDKLELLNINR